MNRMREEDCFCGLLAVCAMGVCSSLITNEPKCFTRDLLQKRANLYDSILSVLPSPFSVWKARDILLSLLHSFFPFHFLFLFSFPVTVQVGEGFLRYTSSYSRECICNASDWTAKSCKCFQLNQSCCHCAFCSGESSATTTYDYLFWLHV